MKFIHWKLTATECPPILNMLFFPLKTHLNFFKFKTHLKYYCLLSVALSISVAPKLHFNFRYQDLTNKIIFICIKSTHTHTHKWNFKLLKGIFPLTGDFLIATPLLSILKHRPAILLTTLCMFVKYFIIVIINKS